MNPLRSFKAAARARLVAFNDVHRIGVVDACGFEIMAIEFSLHGIYRWEKGRHIFTTRMLGAARLAETCLVTSHCAG